MSMKPTRITNVDRIGVTKSGNPYFRVYTNQEPFLYRTAANSSVNLIIENREFLDNPVRLFLDNSGKIYHVEVAR